MADSARIAQIIVIRQPVVASTSSEQVRIALSETTRGRQDGYGHDGTGD